MNKYLCKGFTLVPSMRHRHEEDADLRQRRVRDKGWIRWLKASVYPHYPMC